MSKKRKNTAKKWTCVLCGKHIFRYETGGVVGATGRMVCKDCLEISGQLMQKEKQSKELLVLWQTKENRINT